MWSPMFSSARKIGDLAIRNGEDLHDAYAIWLAGTEAIRDIVERLDGIADPTRFAKL